MDADALQTCTESSFHGRVVRPATGYRGAQTDKQPLLRGDPKCRRHLHSRMCRLAPVLPIVAEGSSVVVLENQVPKSEGSTKHHDYYIPIAETPSSQRLSTLLWTFNVETLAPRTPGHCLSRRQQFANFAGQSLRSKRVYNA